MAIKKINCRAETLLSGLGGEKTRWSEIAAALRISLDNVIGDVLLASAFIAYLGCFPAKVILYFIELLKMMLILKIFR